MRMRSHLANAEETVESLTEVHLSHRGRCLMSYSWVSCKGRTSDKLDTAASGGEMKNGR